MCFYRPPEKKYYAFRSINIYKKTSFIMTKRQVEELLACSKKNGYVFIRSTERRTSTTAWAEAYFGVGSGEWREHKLYHFTKISLVEWTWDEDEKDGDLFEITIKAERSALYNNIDGCSYVDDVLHLEECAGEIKRFSGTIPEKITLEIWKKGGEINGIINYFKDRVEKVG